MFQIIFNKLSASELSKLDTLTQLDLLDQFQVTAEVLDGVDERFGKIASSRPSCVGSTMRGDLER